MRWPWRSTSRLSPGHARAVDGPAWRASGPAHPRARGRARIGPPDVPVAHIVAALNHSIFTFGERSVLREHFNECAARAARRRRVRRQRIGGPGAHARASCRTLVAERTGCPAKRRPRRSSTSGESGAYDALTAIVDCRIHFANAGPARCDGSPDAFQHRVLDVVAAGADRDAREAGFATCRWQHTRCRSGRLPRARDAARGGGALTAYLSRRALTDVSTRSSGSVRSDKGEAGETQVAHGAWLKSISVHCVSIAGPTSVVSRGRGTDERRAAEHRWTLRHRERHVHARCTRIVVAGALKLKIVASTVAGRPVRLQRKPLLPMPGAWWKATVPVATANHRRGSSSCRRCRNPAAAAPRSGSTRPATHRAGSP